MEYLCLFFNHWKLVFSSEKEVNKLQFFLALFSDKVSKGKSVIKFLKNDLLLLVVERTLAFFFARSDRLQERRSVAACGRRRILPKLSGKWSMGQLVGKKQTVGPCHRSKVNLVLV